jgi:hypothetical protein
VVELSFEKYIIRQPMRSMEFFDKLAAGFMTMPPLLFINGDVPVKGVDQFAEAIWVTSDGSSIGDPDRPPHEHNFDELFMFLGSDSKKKNDLGGEVEFWIGEGESAEKYTLNTTSSVFVPRGVVHLPLIFKNVKRPFLMMTICFNIGNKWSKSNAEILGKK